MTEQLKTDHYLAGDKWQFDEGVTDVFENMLERSIPEYQVMRKLVFDLGCRFVKPSTAVIDLGCSRGDALAPFVDKFGNQNNYIGVEVSEPMLMAARRRFVSDIDIGSVSIRKLDLRSAYPASGPASVVLAVLTVMFVPIEYRQSIIRKAYESLAEGGALLLVEKILGNGSLLTDTFIDLYLDMKRGQGYSEEEIQRKKMALEGIQVPVTARWNEEMMVTAGFKTVDCFWRWLNFAGWIGVK